MMTETAVIGALTTTVVALSGVIGKLWLDCKSLAKQLDQCREDCQDDLDRARREHLADVRAIAQSGVKLKHLLEPPSSSSSD